jgi:inorganic triphosphatase YgiF
MSKNAADYAEKLKTLTTIDNANQQSVGKASRAFSLYLNYNTNRRFSTTENTIIASNARAFRVITNQFLRFQKCVWS